MLKTYFFSLLTGLCLLLSPAAQAQGQVGDPEALPRPEETPWSHLVDSLTANLNKSAITTGLLYDRALPLAALHSFGVRRPDTTSSAHLRQAYLELWIASYSRGTFRLTPDQFRERANRVVRHDSVPLAVLDYQFQWLDTLAVRDGLVTVQQGRFYDVANPSRSPYLLRSLTLAAPLVDTLRQTTATFVLPPALLLTNRARRVSGVTVNFSDGGPNRWMLPGQSLTITYAGNGRKVVWFTVQFNDGSTAQIRSSIYVKAPTVQYRSIPVTLANLGIVDARIPFQDYNSTNLLRGRGEVLGVLHNPSSQAEFDAGQPIKLRRPVVFLDGFDPNDQRPLFTTIQQENPSLFKQLTDNGILTLLDEQHLQRDLIILNFPKSPRITAAGTTTALDVDGGADYIERNALVLVELINRLKPMLDIDPATGQPYQFTIIGPSMSGLISRYALAYMEGQKFNNVPVPAGAAANYWEHNTAAWLSFDAPHEGAVVPMGDQAFLSFFQGLAESARENLNNSVNSPAAKQMLVHHILAPGKTPAGAPGFRDRFMRALRDNGEPGSLGYPVHLRRLALADGRLNGQGDFGTPCGKMFDVDVSLRTGNAIVATILSTLLSPLSQVPTRIAACTARYAPGAGTSCTVFEGVINYSIYGYSFPGGFTYVPLYSRRVIDAGSQGSYDLTPGGFRNTQDGLKRQAEAAGRTAGGREQAYKVEVTNVSPNHCFIPTVSALGFQYQNTANYQNTSSLPNPYTNLLGRDLVCNNEIPFDDFYAPTSNNLEHVTTDAGAGAFLFRELMPQVATPVFTAAPTVMCPGSTASFSVKAECTRAGQPGTTYTWSVGNGLGIISGQGTPTIRVQAVPGYLGAVALTVVANRAGYAASTPVTVSVQVAYSSLVIRSTIVNSNGCSVTRKYTAGVNVTNQQWYLDGDPVGISSSINVVFNQAEPSHTITVTADGLCPTGSLTATVTRRESFGGTRVPCGQRQPAPAAYPNPADAILNLAAPETIETAATPRTAVLYNAQGREVRRSSTATATQLPTADLPSGLYYLMVEQNGHVTRSQIRVQH